MNSAFEVTLPVAWAGLLAATALRRHRPPPRRALPLVVSARSGSAAPLRLGAVEPARRLGDYVLRRAGRASAPDPVRSRQVGAAVLAGLAVLALFPLASPAAALAAWAFPRLQAQRRERRRLAAAASGLPEVVDLLALAVSAGLTVPLALAAVAKRATGPLAAELGRACQEVALGRRLGDALDDVPARAGEAVRPLTAALLASERYGAPLAAALDRLADEVRRDRRRRADEAVRRIPVKLLFPLVTCTLPAFALLTVAPLIVSAVRGLHL
jgi:tight adherence protein C